MTVDQALRFLELCCSPFEHCGECGARVVRFRNGRPVCDNGWCRARCPRGEGLCPSPQQIRARARILRELHRMEIVLEPPSNRYSEHLSYKARAQEVAQRKSSEVCDDQ